MEESLETHPISTVTPESVRVSRRLQIKREKRAGKRKLVKINLKVSLTGASSNQWHHHRENFLIGLNTDIGWNATSLLLNGFLSILKAVVVLNTNVI